jgi:hypothetical protein
MTALQISTVWTAPHEEMRVVELEQRTNFLRDRDAGVPRDVAGGFKDLPANHRLTRIDVRCELPTEADAKALAARFPKSLRIKAGPLGGVEKRTGYFHLEVHLSPDGVSGAKNEAGLKRFRRLIEVADKTPDLYTEFNGKPGHWNAYRTAEEFRAALAAYEAVEA